MSKSRIFAAAFAVAGALALGGKASAELITNGDFGYGAAAYGTLGFTSDYMYDSSPGAGYTAGSPGRAGEGYFGIVTNSTYWHPLFPYFTAYSGNGSPYMMIVNGNDAESGTGLTVWEEANIGVTAGTSYTFSYWATSDYPDNPATLDIAISVDGSAISPAQLTSSVGSWLQFTTTFIATSTSADIKIVDTNTYASGNDFALDDISLSPSSGPAFGPTIPLPASALSGSVLLAGVALAKTIRRRRQA